MRIRVEDLRAKEVYEIDTENIQNVVMVFWVKEEGTNATITNTVRDGKHLEEILEELQGMHGMTVLEYMTIYEAYLKGKYTPDRSSYKVEEI